MDQQEHKVFVVHKAMQELAFKVFQEQRDHREFKDFKAFQVFKETMVM